MENDRRSSALLWLVAAAALPMLVTGMLTLNPRTLIAGAVLAGVAVLVYVARLLR